MSFKEWQAVIELAGAAVITGWLLLDIQAGGFGDGSVTAVAIRLAWAIGAVIVFNIIAMIVVAILVSIARGEELKDEKADERDRAVAARAMRNAYVVVSIGAALGLLALALGAPPYTAAVALFAAPMLAGVTDAASRLVYYRLG